MFLAPALLWIGATLLLVRVGGGLVSRVAARAAGGGATTWSRFQLVSIGRRGPAINRGLVVRYVSGRGTGGFALERRRACSAGRGRRRGCRRRRDRPGHRSDCRTGRGGRARRGAPAAGRHQR